MKNERRRKTASEPFNEVFARCVADAEKRIRDDSTVNQLVTPKGRESQQPRHPLGRDGNPDVSDPDLLRAIAQECAGYTDEYRDRLGDQAELGRQVAELQLQNAEVLAREGEVLVLSPSAFGKQLRIVDDLIAAAPESAVSMVTVAAAGASFYSLLDQYLDAAGVALAKRKAAIGRLQSEVIRLVVLGVGRKKSPWELTERLTQILTARQKWMRSEDCAAKANRIATLFGETASSDPAQRLRRRRSRSRQR